MIQSVRRPALQTIYVVAKADMPRLFRGSGNNSICCALDVDLFVVQPFE